MDPSSFELLRRSVGAQTSLLRAVVAELPSDQRGSTYVEFVDQHLVAVEELAKQTAAQFIDAAPEAQVFYGRKLTRLLGLVGFLHGEIFDYRRDIGRNDLPAGLLYLVDHLIATLLEVSADPLIHSDGEYMYATERVVDRWSNLSVELGVDWTQATEPVIFYLPGLDPANAMLAPVLAHEVGHSVIQRNDLVSEVGSRLDTSAYNALIDQLIKADPGADATEAAGQFAYWAEELLCDAIATELTGPSFVFSVAVFFPASSAGEAGDEHPDPAQRLAMALTQLDDNGWRPTLQGACPVTLAWLDAVAQTPPDTQPAPLEAFLRSLVDLSMPHIVAVAKEFLGEVLDWGTYEPGAAALAASVAAGIPPAERDGASVPLWQILVCIWLFAISVHGDNPESLVAAVGDAELSAFALKTVEMSQVAELWRANDAPAP